MRLFSRKKKNETYTTTLNGNTAKGRQELLQELQQNHEELKTWLDIKNNAICICVGFKGKVIGTVDSKITKTLCSKYENNNGLSCDIVIGTNYHIVQSNGVLSCSVTLTVIPN